MKRFAAALVPLLMCAPAWAQEDVAAGQSGESVSVTAAASETVEEIMQREARLPLGALKVAVPALHRAPADKRTDVPAPPVAQWPPADAQARFGPLPLAPQTPGTNFLAMQLSESGFIPAQPSGAVSPTQVLVSSAGRIKVFDKTGTLGALNVTTDSFFAAVGGVTNGTSNVHVRFDRLSQRWYVTAIDVGTPTLICPNHLLVAVSSGPVITDTTSFTFFSFTLLAGKFNVLPTLGVDANAVYVGLVSRQNTAFGCASNAADQSTAVVLNKASLATASATGTVFTNLRGAVTGMFAPQGVDNDDPAATQGYFVDVDVNAFSLLVFRRITNPGAVPPAQPTISADITLTVPTTRFPINQVQPAGNALSALDDRLFAAAIRRDKISGTTALWTSHNIGTNPGCAATGTLNRNGSRWYEIRNLGTTPTVFQSGTLCDPVNGAGANPFGYWIPSVTASGQGHMALGSSTAGASPTAGFASVATAGRLRTDAAGTIQLPAVVFQSTFSYGLGAAPQPWGDYSQTVVDPADDQSIWTFQEYTNATNSWGVRAARLLAPLPALPATAAPASVFEGQPSVNVTLTGTSAAGTEFFDPGPDTGGPGYPNHVASSISGGVTVNSTAFNSTTQLTLNISTVGAPPGAKDVTVTNPDGQTRTGVGVLTVVACPVITVDPPTAPGATIGSPYSVSFSQTGGAAPATFSLAGTLPSGVTFSGNTLSGTPTQLGSFPFTISTRDTNNCPGSRDYTLVVSCQTITVDPPTIPAATAGSAYTQTFTAQNAIGTVTWSLTGTLPSGMSFDTATGVLSGTPTQTGSFPISVIATDGNTCGGSQSYTLVVNCQTISVSPGTVPNATAGSPYSQTFTQTGGIGTVTWSLTGTLPSGMSFDTATGVLSGTPLQTGSFPVTVTASDGNTCTGSVSVTLVVDCQTITVGPGTIPAATAGTAYTQTFTQTNGIGTIAWSLVGTLPSGMSFDTATGVLSGTPTQTGSFPVTVTATDGNNCTGSVSVTLVVNCQTITVGPGTIPAATAGSAYTQTFTQTSGIGAITWSLAGTLPAGMSFDTATGVLSGTPTQTGSFPLTVTATDSNNCTGSVSVTLAVNCQTIGVDPATIPGGQPNTPYSQFFTHTNGLGTVTWSQTGALPTGFSLNTATGELSGTTTDIGSFPITVIATDGNLCTGSRGYTLTIGCNAISVDPATIPDGTAGAAYSQTFTQTGGTGTVTFSLTGTLPTGLTFDTATATLSGTPTQTGSFPITVSVSDSLGCPGSRSYTLVINCATVTVNPATIPSATAGTAYTQAFTQTGGLGTITWSLTGTLPTGLTFDTATGVLSGTPTQVGSFPITVGASDGNACAGTRGYTLIVNRAAPFASTLLAADTGGNSVFEPGETAIVAPTWRNDTGAPETVTGTASNFTGPVALLGGTTYTITDASADYGTVAAGATATCATGGDCYGFQVSNPRPTLHWDSTFTETLSNTDAKTWTLHVGDSFNDVPRTNQYYKFVETILHGSVTGGCGDSIYCPGDSSQRDQMAVFVLVAMEGPGYSPAACTTPLFSDVPASSPFCRFVEELSRRGVVAGCAPGKYCPADPVTREQMAVFALRTLDPTLDPPACTTPMFNDVPAGDPFCKWIEELARRGVVAGCGGGAYCPDSPVSRDQMSVFISLTFGLTLYGQ